MPVKVRVDDFIEMKTAVFGMTRMGKSNTMKTLAVATYSHSKRTGTPIGQLLFDPQGEYANPNSQDDDTALAQLGPDVVIYRFGARAGDTARPLQINFFARDQLVASQELIASVLSATSSGAYIHDFINAKLKPPQLSPTVRRTSFNSSIVRVVPGSASTPSFIGRVSRRLPHSVSMWAWRRTSRRP